MLAAGLVSEQTAQEASPLEVDGIVDAEDADLRRLGEVPADERVFVDALGRKVGLAEAGATTDEAVTDPIEAGTPLEAVSLSPGINKRLMRVLQRVHHYLYDVAFSPRPGVTYKIRTDIRARMLKLLNEADNQPGLHNLFGHGLGTVIAYDALTSIDDAPSVDVLVTAGSPLVRDGLTPPWTQQNGWPSHHLGDHAWWNIYDAVDPVYGLFDREITTMTVGSADTAWPTSGRLSTATGATASARTSASRIPVRSSQRSYDD